MLFAERIRRLGEDKQMLQRQIAGALRIDMPIYKTCSKYEQQNFVTLLQS
jgi:hypothetical protein